MTTNVSASSIGRHRRSRTQRIGATATVLAFFGTAALAPFSLSDAFATDSYAAAFPGYEKQRLTAAAVPETAVLLDSLLLAGVEKTGELATPEGALLSLEQFMFSGVVNWGGYKFTYYSQQVLPGGGLQIPGRHVNAAGYVSDGDGYIVLAGSAALGTVFETPFGYKGKIYDRGTVGNHLDVYIR